MADTAASSASGPGAAVPPGYEKVDTLTGAVAGDKLELTYTPKAPEGTPKAEKYSFILLAKIDSYSLFAT
ncbi:MAG TPA: hypothetical protein VG389_14805, partial [Myxococcota bacterium]|nr:hypothetical protein [Myxococcota bacterium]